MTDDSNEHEHSLPALIDGALPSELSGADGYNDAISHKRFAQRQLFRDVEEMTAALSTPTTYGPYQLDTIDGTYLRAEDGTVTFTPRTAPDSPRTVGILGIGPLQTSRHRRLARHASRPLMTYTSLTYSSGVRDRECTSHDGTMVRVGDTVTSTDGRKYYRAPDGSLRRVRTLP